MVVTPHLHMMSHLLDPTENTLCADGTREHSSRTIHCRFFVNPPQVGRLFYPAERRLSRDLDAEMPN
jgi:hypothetical protein